MSRITGFKASYCGMCSGCPVVFLSSHELLLRLVDPEQARRWQNRTIGKSYPWTGSFEPCEVVGAIYAQSHIIY